MAKKQKKKVIFLGFDLTKDVDDLYDEDNLPADSDLFDLAYRKAESIEECLGLRAELVAYPDKYKGLIPPTPETPKTHSGKIEAYIGAIDWHIKCIKDPRLNSIMR